MLSVSHRLLLASSKRAQPQSGLHPNPFVKKGAAAWTSRRSSLLSTSAALPAAKEVETFLYGSSSVYAEAMYEQYQADPESVPASWRTYFDNDANGVAYHESDYASPTVAISPKPKLGSDAFVSAATSANAAAVQSDSLGVAHLIRAYQVNGHLAAQLDPLGLHNHEAFPYRPSPGPPTNDPDLDHLPVFLRPEFHGFTHADMDRRLVLRGDSTGGNKGYLEELAQSAPDKVTLRQILKELQRTYCGTLGVEYMHIGSTDQCNWIRERVEHPRWNHYDSEKKQHIFERLCFADTFEGFLAQKFNTTKRFGLDGGEVIIPALKDGIDRASELGAHSFVLGMPHRGRLNVLANVMRKPMPLIFSEFQGSHYKVEEYSKKLTRNNQHWGMSGDVKYHLGSSMDRTYPDGRKIHLSLVANPSHLECVDPLVVGKARAKQYYCGNTPEDVRAVVPILLHGDAAVAGQGVVYETLQMSNVPDFSVGGTIHVIVDNQIGFTVRHVKKCFFSMPSLRTRVPTISAVYRLHLLNNAVL
jgi:2-oxoglutarate dehydrogenase E1 component